MLFEPYRRCDNTGGKPSEFILAIDKINQQRDRQLIMWLRSITDPVMNKFPDFRRLSGDITRYGSIRLEYVWGKHVGFVGIGLTTYHTTLHPDPTDEPPRILLELSSLSKFAPVSTRVYRFEDKRLVDEEGRRMEELLRKFQTDLDKSGPWALRSWERTAPIYYWEDGYGEGPEGYGD